MNILHKGIPYKLLATFLSVCFSLISAECFMRIVGHIQGIDYRLFAVELTNSDRLPHEMEGDPLTPNVSVLASTSDFSVIYTINSKGVRDKEYSYTNSDSTKRIVLLGDSFTFGEGIPYGKRYSDITENRLGIEIITMGVPGMGFGEMTRFALTEGIKYKPDAFVFAINNLVNARGGRDVTQYFPGSSPSASLSIVRDQMNALGTSTIKLSRSDTFFSQKTSPFIRWSFILSYIRYHMLVHQLSTTMAEYDKNMWAAELRDQIPGVGEGDLRGTDLTARTAYLIEELAKILQELEIPIILINIDSKPVINLPATLPANITYCDYSAELLEASRHDTLTFIYDQHYNEKTNELLGGYFTDCLKKNGF